MHRSTTLHEALREAASAPGSSGCVVAVAAPHGPVERLLALSLPGVATAWTPGEHGATHLAGRGAAIELTGASLLSLRGEATRALQGLRCVSVGDVAVSPRLVGGQTFDPERARVDTAWEEFPSASLRLPRWWLQSTGERSALCVALPREECERFPSLFERITALLDELSRDPLPSAPAPASACPDSGHAHWDALVGSALDSFAARSATKLVAARRAEVNAARPFDLCATLAALEPPDTGVRFAYGHGDSTFLGASPERLVSRVGDAVRLDALAGSVPRAADDDDRRLARALLASEKDLREHAHVVDGLRAALAPLCARIDAPTSPAVRTLRYVHHLWTPVVATLLEGAPAHVLDLVAALHPTPALGGTPRDTALAWIASRELSPRGWYAAPFGWCDVRGDGEFFVAIRSAVLRGSRAWMYAGAGLVSGSVADVEWRETDAKMSPMRAALGVTP